MADDKKLCLYVTAQELDYIANVLAQRPYAEVQGLIANISRQVQLQQFNPDADPAKEAGDVEVK
jgi:hypothetical protein